MARIGGWMAAVGAALAVAGAGCEKGEPAREAAAPPAEAAAPAKAAEEGAAKGEEAAAKAAEAAAKAAEAAAKAEEALAKLEAATARAEEPPARPEAPPAPPADPIAEARKVLSQQGIDPSSLVVRGTDVTLTYEVADRGRYEGQVPLEWGYALGALAWLGTDTVTLVNTVDGAPFVEVRARAADVQSAARGVLPMKVLLSRLDVRAVGDAAAQEVAEAPAAEPAADEPAAEEPAAEAPAEEPAAEEPAAEAPAEAEAPPAAKGAPQGQYLGRLSGSAKGTVSVNVVGGRVRSGQATVNGRLFRLKATGTSATAFALRGKQGSDYVAVQGSVRGGKASGSLTGGVGGKRVSGSFTATRR